MNDGPSLRGPRGDVVLRPAQLADLDELERLITLSAVELSRGYYDEREVAAAVEHVFGVDTNLICDGTYFVAETGGEIAACGGWSKRRTLFGGDRYAERDAAFSDPAVDAAKIRAFFVRPEFARKGIGRLLLTRCETEARAAGYATAELMSTLPGVPFYAAAGYSAGDSATCTVGGVDLRFVLMRKVL